MELFDYDKIADILALITSELFYVQKAKALGLNHTQSTLLCNFHEFCRMNYTPCAIIPSAIPERDIDDLELSVRASNVLRQLGINTIEEANRLTDRQLRSAEGCGTRTKNEIREVLRGAMNYPK